MAGDTTRKRRLSDSAGGNTTEQNKRTKRGEPQAYPSRSPPKDLKEWDYDSIKPQERDKRCQYGQAKANDGAHKNLSSVDLASVATPDYINTFDNDSDDRIAPETDLGVAATPAEPTATSSVEPASSSKTTAGGARRKKSKTQGAVRTAPTPEDRANARQRMKDKAAKIKVAIASTDSGEPQDKIEAATKAEPSQHDSDDTIAADDPYFKLGCKRRMVFTSDTVPAHLQYAQIPPEHCAAMDMNYPSAVEKFLNWCKKRDKTPRHIVLKMGPPHGIYGRPSTVAAKLKTIWGTHFKTRLRSSHVTIETEIPATFVETGYYNPYMDEMLDLAGPGKLGKRLTVKLEAGPTEALEHADPVAFYKPEIDIAEAWQTKQLPIDDFHADVLSLVQIGWRKSTTAGQDIPTPSLQQINMAKDIFFEQKEAEMHTQREMAHVSLGKVKHFINQIRKFERSKELAQGGSAKEPLVVEDLTTAKFSEHDAAVGVSEALQTPASSYKPKVQNSGSSVNSRPTTGSRTEFVQLAPSESINKPSQIPNTGSECSQNIHDMKHKKPLKKLSQMTKEGPYSPSLPASPKRKRDDEKEEVSTEPQPKVRRMGS